MWKCKKCKEEIEDNFDVCWNCGSDRKGSVTSVLDKGKQVVFNEIKEEVKLEKSRQKYPALKIIAGINYLFAVFIGIAAVIIAIITLVNNESWIIALTSIIVGGLLVLVLIAISELIHVFIDIEYNTQKPTKQKQTSP